MRFLVKNKTIKQDTQKQQMVTEIAIMIIKTIIAETLTHGRRKMENGERQLSTKGSNLIKCGALVINQILREKEKKKEEPLWKRMN